MQYCILTMERLHDLQKVEAYTVTREIDGCEPYYQLLYSLDGGWECTVADEAFRMEPGAIVLIPEQQPYRFLPFSNAGTTIRICFAAAPSPEDRLCGQEEYIEHLQYFAFDGAQERWVHLPLYLDPSEGMRYHTTVETLYRNRYAPTPGTNLTARSYLHLLLSHISADCAEQMLIQYRRSDTGSPLVRSVCEYLNGHYTEAIRLPELSRRFHISTNYLCTVFKKSIGMSVIEYINAHRIEAAKIYLVNTNRSIRDISQSVGFTDEFYFCRLFKHMSEMTPTAFRKKFSQNRS